MKRNKLELPSRGERARAAIGWKLYSLRIKLFGSGADKKKAKRMIAVRRENAIFCAVMLALPLLQFFLFYICVNFKSILLSVQKLNADGDRIWCGLDNFKTLFKMFKTEDVFKYSFKNSLLAYFILTVISTPLTLIFSFYIYKKAFGSKFFKIILFLPSVISSIVMVMIYMYFVDLGIPSFFQKMFQIKISGLYSSASTKFATVLGYNIFMGFGSTILMYLSAMNSINESLVEAAQLEGAGYVQEFFHITLPLIYPTFTTFFVVGIAGIFTNQINLYSFAGSEAPYNCYTFGYYIYRQTLQGTQNYSLLAALGVVITIIVAPTTIGVKWLLERFGPSAER